MILFKIINSWAEKQINWSPQAFIFIGPVKKYNKKSFYWFLNKIHIIKNKMKKIVFYFPIIFIFIDETCCFLSYIGVGRIKRNWMTSISSIIFTYTFFSKLLYFLFELIVGLWYTRGYIHYFMVYWKRAGLVLLITSINCYK